ncbi:MAG: hypothetical protein DI570_03970 [Phenylobacterium zucineum]|nr:MAG: hypothetical protein DI570_03970 [Phenylobacterium zucineum]
MLLSVTLDGGLTLSDGLGAYGAGEDPLLPVSELARLLEADIDVTPAEQRIVGRIGQARSPLLLDAATRTARLAGETVPLAEGDVAVTATEIYVRASVLAKLIAAGLEVAPDELTLRIRPREPFPVQARLDRQGRRPAGAPGASSDQDTLTIAQPYAFFSPPGVDVVLQGGLESGQRDRAFRYDLRFAGDFLWSNVQGYLGSDEDGRATNARLMLQRRSVEGGMLGPLRAREITAGDTYAPGLAMGVRSISGRGFAVSTAPLEQSSVFNQIDLRGELPPGFDVELYINDVLKGGTNQSVNGRYEFLDIPLSPGINVIRVVVYGPRGERNEEVQVINVGAALLRTGEAQLTFGAVEQDQPLIQPRSIGRPSLGDPGVFADHGLRAVAAVNYGITNLLTASAGIARVPRPDGGGLGIYTLGARTSLLGVATQIDGAWDGRGGQGTSIGLAGQAYGASGVLRHAEYRDRFVDENNLSFNSRLELRRRTELTVDSSLDVRGRIVPVSLRAVRNGYADGSHDFATGGRASSSLGSMLVSAGLEYERQSYRPARPVETLRGYIAASTFRGYKWQIRASLDYDVLPEVKARFLAITVDRRLSDIWALRFGIGQPLDKLDGWNFVASSTLSTRHGDLALTGEYDHATDDWRVFAQWTFGLGWDPVGGRYNLMRSGPGTGGSVLFNAFIDENGDGIRQAGEAPAPDVALDGAGGRRDLATGPDGRLLVTGLGSGPTAQMGVSLDKLENASVTAPPAQLRLRPRPGSVTQVDYPLRPTGGVTVKVELQREDGQRVGLSSVRVQLVSGDGAPIEAVTEFDGAAVFDAVPLGAYIVRIDPAQAGKLRMRPLSSPAVAIRSGGEIAPDVTIPVRFEAAASQAATPAQKGGE